MVAAMRVGHERFGTVARPFHRPAEFSRGPRDDRFLRVMVDLAAKTPANIGGHYAQLVLRDLQHERAHQQADHVRVLAGGVERVVAAAGIKLADRGARLHGVGHQAVVGDVQLHHFRGAGKSGVDRSLVAQMPVVADVAGYVVVHRRCAGGEGVGDAGHGGQSLELRLEPFGRIAGALAGVGDHHGDRVADMAHHALGQHRMARLGHRAAVLAVDQPAARYAAEPFGVLAGKNRDHAGRGQGCLRVYAADARMRPVAAQDIGMQLAGPVDVIDVVAVAADKTQILLAPHRGADPVMHRVHRAPPPFVAVRRYSAAAAS